MAYLASFAIFASCTFIASNYQYIIGVLSCRTTFSTAILPVDNCGMLQLDVSENSGTPKSSILIGFSIINHPFWGTPIFGNTQLDVTCVSPVFLRVFSAMACLRVVNMAGETILESDEMDALESLQDSPDFSSCWATNPIKPNAHFMFQVPMSQKMGCDSFLFFAF